LFLYLFIYYFYTFYFAQLFTTYQEQHRSCCLLHTYPLYLLQSMI
jgi:hypothetical protein